MKRIGARLTWAVLASFLAGCGGGGIEEGAPKDLPQGDGRPAGFENMMKGMEKDMAKPVKPSTAKPSTTP